MSILQSRDTSHMNNMQSPMLHSFPHLSDMEKEAETRMPWPAYAEVFEFLTSDGKNDSFRCKLCAGGKRIQSSQSSIANLKKHVQVSLLKYIIINFYFLVFTNITFYFGE